MNEGGDSMLRKGVWIVCGLICGWASAGTIDLQSKIDATARCGGGRVSVPQGTWQTGRIHLKSGVDLHFEDGAVLEFSTNPDDYLPNVKTSWQGEEIMGLSPLVYAFGASNVSITGKGVLKTGVKPWKDWMKATQGRRPQFVQFFLCRNVRLEDFAIRGTPFWTLHLYRSDNVAVKGLDVSAWDDAGEAIMNSDGIDVECSSHVTIRDCTFRQNDDSIVIKSGRDADGIKRAIPTSDVLIERCMVTAGHTLLGIGSEVGGGVRRITLRDCTVQGRVGRLLFVKTNAKRGGFIEDIAVENVRADRVGDSILGLMADYWYYPPPGAKDLHRTPIRGVSIRKVVCTEAGSVAELRGDPELPAHDFKVEDVIVERLRTKTVEASNVENLRVDGLVVRYPPKIPLKKNDPSRGGQEP